MAGFGENTLPYILGQITIALLIYPFIQNNSLSISFQQPKRGILNRDLTILLVIIAYIIYIIFSVGKTTDYSSGTADIHEYELFFKSATGSYPDFIMHKTKFEIGYATLEWIIRRFSPDFKTFLFFVYSLNFICIVRYLRYTKQGYLDFVRIISVLLTLIGQFVTLRMSISISIALNALIAMSQHKYKQAVIITIIATSMQISAIIMFSVLASIALWNSEYIKSPFVVGGVIVLSIVVLYISRPLILRLVENSSKSVYAGQTVSFGGIYIIAAIALYLAYQSKREIIKINSINESLMIALACIFIVLPIQAAMAIAYRFTTFFPPIIATLLNSLCASSKESCNHSDKYRMRTISINHVMNCCIYIGYVYVNLSHAYAISNSLGTYSNEFISSFIQF